MARDCRKAKVYMKKILLPLLILTVACGLSGCEGTTANANLKARTSTLFDKTPQELIAFINENIPDQNGKFSENSEITPSFSDTKTITYTSKKNTLKLLTDEQGEKVKAMRIIFEDRTDVDDYVDVARAIAENSVDSIDEADVDKIVMYFKNYAKLRISGLGKDISFQFGTSTYSFDEAGDNYLFTISDGSEVAKGFGQAKAIKGLSYLISEDWTVYATYDKEGGEVYQTSDGLKVSVLVGSLNINLINLDEEVPIELNKPETVQNYLKKGLKNTIDSVKDVNADWSLSESNSEPRDISGNPGLESTFTFVDGTGQIVSSTKQLTVLTKSNSYTVFMERQAPFSADDLILYETFINSMEIE